MTHDDDLEAVCRGAREGADLDDHDGARLRSAADRLWWSWWQREAKRRHGEWLASGFTEATRAAWADARRASGDDPQRAAQHYARHVLQRTTQPR